MEEGSGTGKKHSQKINELSAGRPGRNWYFGRSRAESWGKKLSVGVLAAGGPLGGKWRGKKWGNDGLRQKEGRRPIFLL